MNSTKNIFTILSGLIIGSYLIHVSYMILSDIPDKKDLIWITSDEVIDARLSGTNAKGRIKLYNENGYCLSVSNKKNGYTELFNAINTNKIYTIGYNPERQLHSDNENVYNIVYEIIINNEVVKSYEEHVKTQRYMFIFIGLLGLFMLLGAILTYIYKPDFQQLTSRSSRDHRPDGPPAT